MSTLLSGYVRATPPDLPTAAPSDPVSFIPGRETWEGQVVNRRGNDHKPVLEKLWPHLGPRLRRIPDNAALERVIDAGVEAHQAFNRDTKVTAEDRTALNTLVDYLYGAFVGNPNQVFTCTAEHKRRMGIS